jgi:hypothetical protein
MEDNTQLHDQSDIGAADNAGFSKGASNKATRLFCHFDRLFLHSRSSSALPRSHWLLNVLMTKVVWQHATFGAHAC